tara:strand:- start:199 stop:654 length:456 start_codon:yes stop_codon:yes gene_type:complete
MQLNYKLKENKMTKRKSVLTGTLAALLVLTGCATTEPTPTVTVTETATAVPAETKSSTKSRSSVEDDFIMYMELADLPSYYYEDSLLEFLINQANTTCGFIDDGYDADTIVALISVAASTTGASDDSTLAFLAASVAATYTYCPEHAGFWD